MSIDTISHYLSASGIRLTICDASSAAAEAQKLHALAPERAAFLGKLLVGAALLATDFKNHEGISVKWETGSPLGIFHVDAYEGRYVRGYAEEAEGASPRLFVTRYSLLRQPYTGAVDLSSADISQGLADYLKLSEQIRAAVKMDWKQAPDGKCQRCAGFLAELLPQGDEKEFETLFSDVSRYDMTEETGAAALLEKGQFTLLAESPVSFRCTCGEERIRDALRLLPEYEQEELIADGVVKSTCRYCGKTYRISTDFLKHKNKKN